MVDQWAQIPRTEQRAAAIAAKHIGGAAFAVEEEDGLLIFRKHFFEIGVQRAREHAGIAFFELGAHIHHIYRRQFQAQQFVLVRRWQELGVQAGGLLAQGFAVRQNAPGQFQELPGAGLGLVILTDARRGGTKYQRGSADARVGFCRFHSAVERLPFSFVVRLMVALIQDDETDIRERYKERAARPDNDR